MDGRRQLHTHTNRDYWTQYIGMGNASLTIHHPSSLEHSITEPDHGKVVDTTPTMIRMTQRDGALIGCGGRVVFRKVSEREANRYSELDCFSAYGGKKNGRQAWTRNDLNLKSEVKWASDSEMIITITL
ncbi:hypothetical protein AALO_G00163480 [Alosa alosa]|uniref:Uncharacterized protein n=1 Tax=Alosa alosa TaxID=278164 RepID=A0AAV6GDV3_9TELE|nr:hypothetical protein AALO_G00163480 [Alosa alosa]